MKTTLTKSVQFVRRHAVVITVGTVATLVVANQHKTLQTTLNFIASKDLEDEWVNYMVS